MRVSVHRLVALSLVTLLVAACGSAAGSPSPVPAPSGSSAPPPSTPPATAEPSPTPDETVAARARLRVTTVQALPPDTTFAVIPQIVISNDGRVLMGGPIPLIFPGPLVTPVVERQIGPAGWSRLVAAARAAGLLGLNRDFTGGQMPPGSAATRLEIVADGLAYDLLGDANRVMVCVQEPCVPPPGTPEAFAGFVNGLWDITTMAGAENLGPERVHAPAAYGVLVGAVPDDGGLAQQAIDWPLDGGFAAFGKPLANGNPGRCGTVSGADVALLRPAFTAATMATPWKDTVAGTMHGLVVRPVLPGDGDPCEGLV